MDDNAGGGPPILRGVRREVQPREVLQVVTGGWASESGVPGKAKGVLECGPQDEWLGLQRAVRLEAEILFFKCLKNTHTHTHTHTHTLIFGCSGSLLPCKSFV